MAEITHSELLATLDYNQETGEFSWARDSRRVRKGQRAGSLDVHGYLQINLGCGRVMKLHRLAWFYTHGEWPNGQIDHINHNRTDNRLANLRVVDTKENHRNRPLQSSNKTGFHGVSFCKNTGRYRSTINVSGKQMHLGRFDTIAEAALARATANVEHGFHPNHGIGEGVPTYYDQHKKKRNT